jgi:hypothetical protein
MGEVTSSVMANGGRAIGCGGFKAERFMIIAALVVIGIIVLCLWFFFAGKSN